MGPLLRFLSFVMLMGACSDYSVTKIEDPPPAPVVTPDIVVEPTVIDFGTLSADGSTTTETITITNAGSDTLNISNVQLDSTDAVFTLSSLTGNDSLEPDENATFTVTYDPETYETNSNTISITSDDPNEPTTSVALSGVGSSPLIDIQPNNFDFDYVLIGCEETLTVTISNIGDSDLIIDQIDYYITYPADLSIEDYEDVHGPLPWTIAAGDSVELQINYAPTDVDMDAGIIEVYSNDPQNAIADADQIAEGTYPSIYEETFTQEEITTADILFVVDNSGSMSSNQTQLALNFDTFMNVFITSGIDYHIAFITTDSYDLEGALITTATTDPAAVVADIIDNIGTHGSTNERGIYFSYYALQSGYEAGPGSDFWRADSKLIIIYVSDEDDHSSGVTPTMLKNYTVLEKGGASYVTAHAVAGDYPGGCTANGGAQEAFEYYTIVNYLSGTFLSICEDDWGTPLETLAHDSILKSSFTLAQAPIEETLSVYVDGVENTDWTFDASTNAVDFSNSTTPDSGSSILVSYAPVADCPEEESDTGI